MKQKFNNKTLTSKIFQSLKICKADLITKKHQKKKLNLV